VRRFLKSEPGLVSDESERVLLLSKDMREGRKKGGKGKDLGVNERQIQAGP
jgi:hypothetical protein